MIKTLKEKIAGDAASTWCSYKSKFLWCNKWYDNYRTAMLALEDDRLLTDLWKPADKHNLPEYGRMVIAIQKDVDQNGNTKPVFAMRIDKDKDGSISTYKDDWNKPNILMWLDLNLPKYED